MARLYADEQFPRPAVEHLRSPGYNVLTAQEAGNASASDPEVFMFAIAENL
jgi:predicted nuclease of predicted toxin-antitoxin system